MGTQGHFFIWKNHNCENIFTFEINIHHPIFNNSRERIETNRSNNIQILMEEENFKQKGLGPSSISSKALEYLSASFRYCLKKESYEKLNIF